MILKYFPPITWFFNFSSVIAHVLVWFIKGLCYKFWFTTFIWATNFACGVGFSVKSDSGNTECKCQKAEDTNDDDKNGILILFFSSCGLSCLKNILNILRVDWLSVSEITNGIKQRISVTRSSFKLILKVIKMSLLNWVHRCKNIPIYFSITRWCSNWSLIYPSVAPIYDVYKVGVCNSSRFPSLHAWSILSKLNCVEEIINDTNFVISKLSCIFVYTEEDTKGRIWEIMKWMICLRIEMNGMHF